MSVLTPWDAEAISPSKVSFKVQRAFKALDDGRYRKWVVVVRLQDLPDNLPLDANARVPHVLKNKTCADMRATLLAQPDLFQIFNGGVVCTANGLNVRQVENSTYVEIEFDSEGGQGIVNGGHSYATALLVAHNATTYSDGKDLLTVLAEDTRTGSQEVKLNEIQSLLANSQLLAERVAKAKQQACLQIEIVAPIPDAELLARVAHARNISQPVEKTALANLAGKYEHLKDVLGRAFGQNFVDRVVWRTNQAVPEDSRKIPVNLLHYAMALINIRSYQPGLKVASEVFSRPGLVIRDYVEAEDAADKIYRKIEQVLPVMLELYDYIYLGIAESDADYPWGTGKIGENVRHRPTFTPFFADACPVKVDRAFHWPVFSAFRQLLAQNERIGAFELRLDPFALFDEIKSEMVSKLKSFHQEQAHGLLQQVGRDRELWIRLDSIVEREIEYRRRNGTLSATIPAVSRRGYIHPLMDDEPAEFIPERTRPPANDPYTGRRPASITFRGKRVEIQTWHAAHAAAAAMLAAMYPTQFAAKILGLNSGVRPYAARDATEMFAGRVIPGTPFFIETGYAAKETVRKIKRLFEQFGHAEGEWQLEVADRT